MTHEWAIHRETSKKLIVRKLPPNHKDQMDKAVFKSMFVFSSNFFVFVFVFKSRFSAEPTLLVFYKPWSI